MKLSVPETDRFYRIWLSLLNYVNDQRHLVAPLPLAPGPETINIQDVRQIRDVLWQDDALLEGFVAKNPHHLSDADVAIAASWRYRVAGQFFIMRYLNRYTVFLTYEDPPQAFGVLGLVSPIQEIARLPPPVLVNAVLLPFGDRIIYDSLLIPYNISFGSGIRRSLNERYRQVQERGGVITTLLPASPDLARQAIGSGNQKVLAAFRKELAAGGVSLKMIEQHTANVVRLLNACAGTPEQPRSLLELEPDDLHHYLQTTGKGAHWVSLRRLVRFLGQTHRIDQDKAEAMLRLLKQR